MCAEHTGHARAPETSFIYSGSALTLLRPIRKFLSLQPEVKATRSEPIQPLEPRTLPAGWKAKMASLYPRAVMARLSLFPQARGLGEVLRAETSFRKLVREPQEYSPLVDGQGARRLRAACRDFLRKVVLSSSAVARPSLWISVIWGEGGIMIRTPAADLFPLCPLALFTKEKGI